MSQPWDEGSAARQPQYEEAPNPFTPVNYAQRLSRQPQQRSQRLQGDYQPGQLYGYQPPVYSPPPAAAPVQEAPAYMQPQTFEPAQFTPGMPYGANAWQSGPAAYQQPLQSVQQPPQEQPVWVSEPVNMPPVWTPEPEVQPPLWAENTQEGEPVMPPQEELRDAYTPARNPRPVQKAQQQPERPPVRVGRVLSLIMCFVLFVFCAVGITRLAVNLRRAETGMLDARESFREENGVELLHAAARVDLLPEGQTFVPTAAPTPTLFAPTPSPTPLIPIHEAAVAALDDRDTTGVEAGATDVPVLRTKLTGYPKNPLNNIHQSLQAVVKEYPDVIGRLVIPGVVDEMVVQRNNTYYLTRSYTGANSEAGSVFVDEACSIRLPPENLLLRAQCSVPGRAFAPLLRYVSGGTAFVSTAAAATLTTLYEEERYVLFAVIHSSSDTGSPSYFNYASNPTFATDASMMQYVESARARSLYPFSVDVQPSDRLLTLATLGGESTVVLMFRMVRDGETY